MSENSIQDFDAGKSDTANIAENYSSLFTTSRADSSTISESAAVVRNKTFGAPYYNTNAYTTSNVALVNYTVTVAPKSSGSGNAFYFNGMEQLNSGESYEASSTNTKKHKNGDVLGRKNCPLGAQCVRDYNILTHTGARSPADLAPD